MGFNEKGEIIRKSGSQRQTQFEYGFFDILKTIAYGTAGVLFLIVACFFPVTFWYLIISFFEGSVINVYVLILFIAGILLSVIMYIFAPLLDRLLYSFLYFLDKQSFGVIFILLALWDTIFVALVFWLLSHSQEVNFFAAFFRTLSIACILYILGRVTRFLLH